MTRAQLDKQPAEVSAMFDRVAERYDLLNDALSLGMDRRWRKVVARSVDGASGQLVLDLAAGTGTSSRAFSRRGARCVACDFSLGMLAVGARRPAAGLAFAAGDALALPFRDATFDVVTISFGLRNVADTGQALSELLRVTRPGGRLVICEFSHLPVQRLNAMYEQYLARVLPAVARRLSGNAEAYDYLAESIRDWPPQQVLAGLIAGAGWSGVSWRNLTLGVVALHEARRPG
ncbi:MAG TPA: demethylmenaquinone methyltransferase [Streptosporangiaceae bacterium]|jgi:demethylmenaquinone methyltransferase/2-methoxy-6-polyprenyl-1,4-benzoquinol methylase